MTRRDAPYYAAILATILTACVLLSAMNAPVARIAPAADRPKAAVEWAGRVVRWPEMAVEPASLSNPTPLSDELYRAVLIACTTYNVPECLALGLIEVESGFDAEAVGPDGHDIGLFQIRVSNHAWLTAETEADPMTPEGNIKCGVYMLSYLIGRYETAEAALTAYRWGHDNGDRKYAEKVLRAAEAWEEAFEA